MTLDDDQPLQQPLQRLEPLQQAMIRSRLEVMDAMEDLFQLMAQVYRDPREQENQEEQGNE